MKHPRIPFHALLAAACALGAWRAAADDVRWELVIPPPPLPVDSASNAWQTASLASLYPWGGGFAATGFVEEQPASKEESHQQVAYRLEEATWGSSVSELRADFNLGDYLTAVAFPAGTIDWVATSAAISNSAAFAEGYVYYFGSTNDEQRILFTRGGVVEIPWMLKGSTNPAPQAYTIGHTSMARPFRIFWTSEPFKAPPVDLSKKYVRLLGDPDIVQATWETNNLTAVNGVSNRVRGVFFDSASETLQCNARTIDAEHDQYDGPEGQFVVAYYDTGNRGKLLATVVVEAARPKVNVIPAEIGDELRPNGGGYDIEGLESEISTGGSTVKGDDASPHLYQYSSQDNWNPKKGAVFAISPTDGTSSKTGDPDPWNAAVYWKEPDCMGVLWPFEEDFYLISWPKEPVYFAISEDAENPGLPIFAPTNYTTSLCDWQDPPKNATADNDGCVSATKEGWFTLQIQAQDNIWFQPVRAFSRTNPAVAMTNAAVWEIGREIELLGGTAARNTADAAEQADATLPGYIYQAAATGRRNWNPRLYHEPKQDSAADDLTAGAGADSASDPYETLRSAIYPVNISDGPDGSPIEVWWSQSIRQDGMEGAIRIPCVVQRYLAAWPAADDVPTIVIASQKGSDGNLLTPSGGALYLASTNDMARVDGLNPGDSSGVTFGYWQKLSPKEAGRPELQSGAVVHLYAGGTDGELVFDCDSGVHRDEWIHVAYAIGPATTNGTREGTLFNNGRGIRTDTLTNAFLLSTNRFSISLGASPSAPGSGTSGIAFDDFCVWRACLTNSEIAEVMDKAEGTASADRYLVCRFDFDAENDLVPIPHTATRYASDSAPHGSRKLVSDGPLKMTPGVPKPASGIIRSDEGVPAEIYYENDPSMSGYNPNDEHAILLETPGGWAAYALRCDLASEEGSQPLVLVQYAQDGKGAMRPFGIALTNAAYPSLESSRTAGLMFTPPHPLDTLDFADNEKTYAITVPETKTNSFGAETQDTEVVYRDHFKRLWARRDGKTDAYYYYAMREGFWLPGLQEQPATGTLVPWLARVADTNANVLTGAPHAWRWDVAWPTNDVPSLQVAQTLTKAENGLPEVWNALSMAVIFPAPVSSNTMADEAVVHLIDPTVARSEGLDVKQSFPDEYGFTLGSSGTTHLKKGKYYFTGLPPSIADRFYVDAANQKMVLVGQYVEKAAGGSYLQLNVLTPEERAGLHAICKATGDAKTNWTTAVNALATNEVQPNTTSRGSYSIPKTGGVTSVNNIETAYSAVDHYALVASGEGSGYVTLIENDNPDTKIVPDGSPVSVHVLRVDPKLYAGGLTVITDPMNKLSEQLTIAYTEPFGAAADQYEFEWRRTETTESGDVPKEYDTKYRKYAGTNGLVSILLGANGADLKDLQNMYYVMRYRALSNATPYRVVGTNWSAWCGPTLAEGWIQRVLNAVTPFAQRCSDFSEYTSDIAYSMMEQIGPPWQGDVALNNDNLENVGLLELYQTVLNRAESMSLDLGAKTDAGVCKQLLLAASRIAELYGLLGDEAYSDAKNPTVGSRDFSPSVFCFQNQLPTLLDEELALLRGRTTAVAPAVTNYPYPYYNRLIWNFTKGVTEGEVAYVNNYGIRGSDGEITVEQAAKQYPQGHGDAYGHYLDMVKSFYHLAQNPYFDWYATMTEMLLGDSIVNVDYFDEEKFAEAAGKLARTAADTMDMTARKAWHDGNGLNGAGYFDADTNQAFGYGEWATRGGYGALCNWAAVNALLPTNGTPADAVFEDRGVKRIDRSSASSLAYLPETVRAIQQRLDALDYGMNPLGLSDNAVPFDFDPTQVNGNTATPIPPFEQILSRAEKALGNARTVLEYANEFGARLAAIAAAEAEAEDGHETVEASYNKDLIAIYGTPLAGDIGPGKTYAQGYDGPDLFHYTYIDLRPYGLETLDSALSTNFVRYVLQQDGVAVRPESLNYMSNIVYTVTNYTTTATNTVVLTNDLSVAITYTLTPDGIPQAQSGMGVRRTEGSIQEAYRDFLAAYLKTKQAVAAYDKSVKRLDVQCGIARAKLRMAATDLAFDEVLNAATIFKAGIDLATGIAMDALDMAKDVIGDAEHVAYESTPKIVGAGMTVNVDPSAIVGSVASAVSAVGKSGIRTSIYGFKTLAAATDFYVTTLEAALKGVKDGFDYYDAQVESWERLKDAVDDTIKAANDVQNAYAELAATEQAYRTEIAKGDALLEELAMVRKHWANEATAIRYEDMYNRIRRNDALAKYTSAFDTAQRYVYLLAKVYDYETGLLSSDPLAGDGFMRSIVAARSLGESGIASSKAGTLWDAVTRMSANWDVLKGRLGINNPEKTTTWFSLRYSLFRIKPGPEGDKAWRDALTACWRDDLWSDPEIARYCQPPESDTAPVAAEPGLVIAFPTAINLAENFFGKPLLGGEAAYSSSDWAVRVFSAGIRFKGYEDLETQTADGLASSPNVYLVPVGRDCMRAPLGTSRETIAFKVLDQVLPVPYETGDMAGLLADPSWVSTLSGGGDGVTIRRHSTMAANGEGTTSTRLVGRSVWNDRWLLVIPASSLSSDRANALKTFIHGLDTDKDGNIDVPGVSDIELGFRTFSRSGN